MQESMSDRRFLGLPVRELEALGLDPRRRIVPLWFGCRAALAAVPSSCPIEVSGRSQFKLFINGVSVHFGPCRSAREVAYVDTLDIAPWLRAGENRLAMQVFSYPEHPGEEEGPYHCFGDDEGPAISVTGRLGDLDLAAESAWRAWPDAGQGFNRHQVFMMGSN